VRCKHQNEPATEEYIRRCVAAALVGSTEQEQVMGVGSNSEIAGDLIVGAQEIALYLGFVDDNGHANARRVYYLAETGK
jgi:hypothetical protein